MPKKSYKVEFIQKQSLLGMPKDRDWALIANYADKTLIRNFIAYNLSSKLGTFYTPRCEFAELYVNAEYLGVYLLTETIKIEPSRVNIPKNEGSYIIEFDEKHREQDQVIFSNVLTTKAFKIHHPKNARIEVKDSLLNHINSFEKFLKTIKENQFNKIDDWIDINESAKHYWVQELTKNPDANFRTSVYFSWVKYKKIKMGPVWDFDLAFGNYFDDSVNSTKEWHTHNYWNSYLFKDSLYRETIYKKWIANQQLFESTLSSIDSISSKLKVAASNNFKRWKILGTSKRWLHKPYNSYKEAVEDLKKWTQKRIQWINHEYNLL